MAKVFQSVVRMYKEVRQTAEDHAHGNVLAPRGTIARLIKQPEAGNHVSTTENIAGESLGGRCREPQMANKEARPAIKNRLEDIQAINVKAQGEVEVQEDRLQNMVAEERKEEDHIGKDIGHSFGP